MPTISSSKDLLVLLLAARGVTGKQYEPVHGRTRLVKMLFLFTKEVRTQFSLDSVVPESALPDFEPYKYGPFSSKVYEDLDFLLATGFVRATDSSSPEDDKLEADEYDHWQDRLGAGLERAQDGVVEVFGLTALGRAFVEVELGPRLTTNQWTVLDLLKRRCSEVSLLALIRYVYTRYPEMAKDSLVRDKVLGTSRE